MLPSLVRTYVPYLVGLVVSWLSMLGITVTDDQRAMLVTAIGWAVGTAYHLLVRLAERRWPALSVLLGSRKQPTYARTSSDGQARVITSAPERTSGPES